MKKIIQMILLLSASAGIPQAFSISGAISIPVENHSFEKPENSKTVLGNPGESWTWIAAGSPNSACGVIQGGQHGRQYLFIAARKKNKTDFGVPNRLYQRIDHQVKVGDKLVLTVALSAYAGDPENFNFGLFADETMKNPLALKTGTEVALSNNFRDFSVEWVVGKNEVANKFYIGFQVEDYGSDVSTPRLGVDNIRLSKSEGIKMASTQPRIPFFEMQELFIGRGGRNIVVALDGTVLAFHTPDVGFRRSQDGGATWTDLEIIDKRAKGNVIVDTNSGDILYINPAKGLLWRSTDHGNSWRQETMHIEPNFFGHGTPDGIPQNSVAAESGITIQFGAYPRRLLSPSRIAAPSNSNDEKYRAYHYNCALYSDDGGKNWQTSDPFPILGTGEGALVELSTGEIYYNSRCHTATDCKRREAWSFDSGRTWINPGKADLPDGLIGDSYGCHGGLIRLPFEGQDIILFSNLDAEMTGGMRNRRNITVWVSFDGAKSWPVKKLIYDGPGAYSCMASGRPGTQTDGLIYMLFEGGAEGVESAIQLVRFNLEWLLDGVDISQFFKGSM
ncbi:MAG: sialidase family protein [Kiritimatiellales bacterium]